MQIRFLICLLIFSSPVFGQEKIHNKKTGSRPSHVAITINEYAQAFSFDACTNKIKVDDASKFFPGDTVLVIQMKGAVIDSSNTSTFGDIIDYGNSGNYEFNYVTTVSGNVIELKNNLTRKYDIPNGSVQLVRVPFYQNFFPDDPLTCLPWNGSIGGILVVNVADTFSISQPISISTRGFLGAINANMLSNTAACGQTDFYSDSASTQFARKGEGIGNLKIDKWNGRGKFSNGGGGGNGHNSGGGGGGNYAIGGYGGNQIDTCGNIPFINGGKGGAGLNYNTTLNKIFMGGGGGAGHLDTADPSYTAAGGNGGGIVIIKAGYFLSNDYSIDVLGDIGQFCLPCNSDGFGGGGAGGTVLMDVGTYLDSFTVNVDGGTGSSNYSNPPSKAGPGGGGGAGVVWFAGNIPSLARITKKGGKNGSLYFDSLNPWGSGPGGNGGILSNLSMVYDTTPFIPTDSIHIKDSTIDCNSFSFDGSIYNNYFPVVSWKWSFGDGMTDVLQNTFHTYLTGGNFPVTLTTTDSYGCIMNKSVNAMSYDLQVDAGPDTTICWGESVLLQATNSGGTQFAWTPGQTLNDSTILNPIASPLADTKYYLSSIISGICNKKDSVSITVHNIPTFTVTPSFNLCTGDSARLLATGGQTYLWSQGNLTIPNPVYYPIQNTVYTITITDTICTISQQLSTTVTLLPLPDVQASKENDIDCLNDYAQLHATGATRYLWSPGMTLNNPGIADPLARPDQQTIYTVKGVDGNGCVNSDTVKVEITNLGKSLFLLPSAFTPNNDGLNDCFGTSRWGIVHELNFTIFNRWGEIVYHTTTPGNCWNGRSNGTDQPGGVYVYIIKAKTSCGFAEKKGSILLIR